MLNWLFVDLNSYFASVEQQLRPELRGRPVGVVPLMADTTSCIAASYQAKKFGVKTGTMVGDAKRMCPGIALVEARHERYIEFHEKIVAAVESCLPVTSVMSIDEVACRLNGSDRRTENAVKLGRAVKAAILRVGSELTSSVGLSSNRLLAKIASDMEKPDGLTIIQKEELPGRLFSLKLRDLPGVGPNMEQRLRRFGVTTVEQLCRADQHALHAIWGGVGGDRFFRWLAGEDFTIESETNRSISHSHVLPPELRTQAGSYAVLQKLLQKAGTRLRKMERWASSLHVSASTVDRRYWVENRKMLECQDTLTLLENLEAVWKGKPREIVPMKVTVALGGLIHDSERSFSFFDSPKRVKLAAAMDKINAKFGSGTLYFGGVHDIKAAAPTRIAFQSIPDLEI